MPSFEDVARVALALPETDEQVRRGQRRWRVREKLFVWERPLRTPDLQALGERAPRGAILGARVEHLIAKEALIAEDPAVVFTTPHFDGYAAVLIVLEAIDPSELEEVVVDAWLARAPKRVADAYLHTRLAQG